MALHITNPELDAPSEQAQKILNAESKTDAVRQALERAVEDEAETLETIAVVPITDQTASPAIEAFARYGKGRIRQSRFRRLFFLCRRHSCRPYAALHRQRFCAADLSAA